MGGEARQGAGVSGGIQRLSENGHHTKSTERGPYKLDDEIADKIYALLARGNRLDTAAAAVGIARSTLHEWLRKGRKEPKGVYGVFVAKAEQAMALAEADAVNTVTIAGAAHWQARAWWLERKFPEQWGRRDTHLVQTQVKGELEGMLNKLQSTLSPEEYERVLAIIAARDDGAGEAGESSEERDE